MSVNGGESAGGVAALARLHLAREDDVGRASHLGCLQAVERIDTALACGSPLGVHLLRQLAQPLLLLALGYRFAVEAAQAGQRSGIAVTLGLCHCRAVDGTCREAFYIRAVPCSCMLTSLSGTIVVALGIAKVRERNPLPLR